MGARKAVASGQSNAGHNTGHVHREKHGISRLWPYVPPWLIWLTILGIAALGRWLWGGTGFYPVLVELWGVGAIVLVLKMTKTLHEVLRMLAAFSVAVVTIFIILVGILGLNAVLWSLWGGIGFSVCSYWTMRRMLLPEFEKGQRQASPMAQRLIDALGGASIGSPKQKVIEGIGGDTQELPGPIHVPITVNRGEQTRDELKHIPETVETIAGLRPGAARLVHSSTDAGKTELVVNPVDLLAGGTPWRGPSAFGESISLPVPVGMRAGMSLARIFMVGDESEGRNLVQWLIMGMPGAGKSQFMRMLAADLSTRKKVTQWAHDHVKGLQTLKPLIEGGALDWVTMTKTDGKAMLAAARLVIQARARWLGIKGFDNWTDDCGLNVLIVWLEEASELAQMSELLKLVREGRSVGVIIVISLQRASHTSIDTDTRAALAGNICFGVESDQDAKFGLPDHVIDAGAAPERWRADNPGYCYIAAPGTSHAQQAEELRTFFATKEQVIETCKRGAVIRTPLRDEIDQVTIKAAGNVYAKRVPPEAFLDPKHPLFAKGIGMKIDGLTNTTDSDDMESEDVVDNNSAMGSPATTAGNYGGSTNEVDDDELDTVLDTDEAEDKLSSEADIPECPVPDLGPEKPREYKWQELSKDEQTVKCRELVQSYIRALDADGKAFVTVPDIQRMKPPVPRGREWIRGELKRLAGEIEGEIPDAERYRLERDEEADAGTFRIVPPRVAVGVPEGA
jgi:hypothetical protein